METSTNKITDELYNKAREDFIRQAVFLRRNGMSDGKIQDYFVKFLEKRRLDFYDKDNQPKLMGFALNRAIENWCGNKADSKAEHIFYDILNEHDIPFSFQEKIGPYRVDFLIKKNLVFECDGPQHQIAEHIEYDTKRDKYLEKLGYKVMRFDWEIIQLMTDEIIELIKKEI